MMEMFVTLQVPYTAPLAAALGASAAPQGAPGVLRPAHKEAGAAQKGAPARTQAGAGGTGACGAKARPPAGPEAAPGPAPLQPAHGTRRMPLQEKLDAVDEYRTGDSLYTVAARHGIALAAARRLVASRTLLRENERRRRRLIALVCSARPPVRPVCRGCVWGCRATGLCTQPRCLNAQGPQGQPVPGR